MSLFIFYLIAYCHTLQATGNFLCNEVVSCYTVTLFKYPGMNSLLSVQTNVVYKNSSRLKVLLSTNLPPLASYY